MRIDAKTLTRQGVEMLLQEPVPAEALLSALRTQMQEGVAHFAYLKKDGSVREAYGTLCTSLIPASAHPAAGTKPKPANPDTQTYYDIGAGEFRTFTRANLIGYVKLI